MELTLTILQAVLDCPYKAWQIYQKSLDPVANIKSNKIAEIAWQIEHQKLTIESNQKPPKITKQALELLENARNLLNRQEEPPFYKVAHCAECQFNEECFNKLKARDCLSLLGGMTPKIIAKYHSRGMTTITQLSYLYRPRRRKKGPIMSGHYSWELKALAIREQKTFILHPPELTHNPVSIYVDFEGLPNESTYYLLGGIIKEEGKEDNTFSYWANNPEEEQKIFIQLVNILQQYPEAPIYHFGSYESNALKTAAKKYPDLLKKQLPFIEKRMRNLLSFMRSHVYSPTYTNGLKDIGNYLGLAWSDNQASGLQSIRWRYQWHSSGDVAIKEKLQQYNTDDCKALHLVYLWLLSLSMDAVPKDAQLVSALKRHTPYKLQSNPEYGEDFQIISKAAYFDYQRSKIYWRDKKSPIAKVQKSEEIKKKGVVTWQPKQANEVIIVPPLKACPHCGNTKLYQSHEHSRTKVLQTDLKFTISGIRQHVIEYQSGRAKCAKCGIKTSNRNLKIMHFGDNFFAYVINMYVTCHISHEMISRMLNEQFHIRVKHMYLVMRKEKWWTRNWEPDVQYIRSIVLNSPVIHIDETTVKLSQNRGYVWVLATTYTVYYHYTPTREVDFLKEWLKDYKGIIITDFFPGYETLQVRRQKCLVHLIRDLNDDLFKNPFDEEYKMLVSSFSKLLRNIIVSIDKHGLQKKFLEQHSDDINTFSKNFLEVSPKSELSIKYGKRLKKHWEQIWTFIHEDNVPWNNNNAEAAIKAFAQHRRGVNGQINERGLKLYLQMLSVAQTCRYRNISFLGFLRRKVGLWEKLSEEMFPGFLPFRQAKLFIQKLGFERKQQWNEWKASGARPSFIPSSPERAYKNKGWVDWHDWIGFSFLPFPKARAFMRKLHLKNRNEYWTWLSSDKRPKYIPYSPEKVYKHTGWIDLGDYLGTGNKGRQKKKMLSYWIYRVN